MTRDEVIAKWNSMNPQERNIWVAVKVMGKKKSPINYGWISSEGFDHYPKDYSTGMGAAWEVIQKMKDKGFSFTLGEASEKSRSVILGEANLGDPMCNFHIVTKNIFIHVFKETMPEAICLATLIAQGEGIEE
ncbi:BC1872 family protein [Paenibacillus peoriae]|uniref:BC1872 family protein n=1 Tax=Paenibacillus peoriae TaxID=59893 RepID=UPI00096FF641|nr:hypothetical protein [Paenibacillus peoriae]OMF48613.1 hypothetical protein BK135_09975 [Paenibacillus peoriae]